MDEKIKSKVFELKAEGMGYRKIAKELNLPVSTVSSVFLRLKDREEKYLCGVVMLRQWKNMDILADEEFVKAEKRLAKKFSIKKDSIYRPNDLINSEI